MLGYLFLFLKITYFIKWKKQVFHNTCNSLSLVIKSIFNFYIFNFYSFKRKRYSIPIWLHLNKKIIVLRLLLLVFPSGGYSQSLKSVYPQPLSHSSSVDTDFITKSSFGLLGTSQLHSNLQPNFWPSIYPLDLNRVNQRTATPKSQCKDTHYYTK